MFTLNLKNGKGQKLRRSILPHGGLVTFNFDFQKSQMCSCSGFWEMSMTPKPIIIDFGSTKINQHNWKFESLARLRIENLRVQHYESSSDTNPHTDQFCRASDALFSAQAGFPTKTHSE